MAHFLNEPGAAVHSSEHASMQAGIHDSFEMAVSGVVRIGRSVPADRHLVKLFEGCSDPGLHGIQLTMGPLMGSHGFTPALVAQRIRASDYGSEGREFESLQARLITAPMGSFFLDAVVQRSS